MTQHVWTAKAELTDHTPSNLSFEQWGTEEAEVTLASLPAGSLTIVARLTGRAKPNSATSTKRGQAKVMISIDGGTTWSSGWTGLDPLVTVGSVGTAGRIPLSDQALRVATPTGNVQARAECCDIAVAGDFTFEGGRIVLEVYRGNS